MSLRAAHKAPLLWYAAVQPSLRRPCPPAERRAAPVLRTRPTRDKCDVAEPSRPEAGAVRARRAAKVRLGPAGGALDLGVRARPPGAQRAAGRHAAVGGGQVAAAGRARVGGPGARPRLLRGRPCSGSQAVGRQGVAVCATRWRARSCLGERESCAVWQIAAVRGKATRSVARVRATGRLRPCSSRVAGVHHFYTFHLRGASAGPGNIGRGYSRGLVTSLVSALTA